VDGSEFYFKSDSQKTTAMWERKLEMALSEFGSDEEVAEAMRNTMRVVETRERNTSAWEMTEAMTRNASI
jgi:hypothetical protein